MLVLYADLIPNSGEEGLRNLAPIRSPATVEGRQALRSEGTINGRLQKVLVKESSNVRTIILNRPTQLNVLSLETVTQLLELFRAHEDDPSVKMIILKIIPADSLYAEVPLAAVISSAINSNGMFSASPNQARTKLRQACFDYLSLGGMFSSGQLRHYMVKPLPSSLVLHFFSLPFLVWSIVTSISYTKRTCQVQD
ncbi:Crotonase superfamily [Artemisia annua]|uniref:3-hydroxyisobutyryl-CoA hydrolase n=1 Tax=Artemisia annua TaxID=35608 RepID=A0A2U1QJZ2_ARTAN|nr:Crotonase superfamily [Artemisia annua]